VLKKITQPNLDLGFVKLTVNKLYRITCASHQSVGIIPDIQVTFTYDGVTEHEKDYKTALSNDFVTKNVVYKKYPALPLQYLQAKSSERIKSNDLYDRIDKVSKESVDNNYMVNGISLQIDQFKKSAKQVYALLDRVEKLSEKTSSMYQVTGNAMDKEVFQKDEYLGEIVEEEIESIQKDIYIEEAYSIIKDLIDYKQNKITEK
jgi:carboxyl-terminal processing protease